MTDQVVQGKVLIEEDVLEDDTVEHQQQSQSLAPTCHIPQSKAVIKQHYKCVTALSFTPQGNHLITGSRDYSVHLYDFNQMDQSLQSQRQVYPWDGYHIHDLQFNRKGNAFICCSGASSVKLFNRDGSELVEFQSGDMYLKNLKRCSGHISAVSQCLWSPHDESVFATGSTDSTIRIWSVEQKRQSKECYELPSKKNHSIGRLDNAVNSICFKDASGNTVMGAGQLNGSIYGFDRRTPHMRPCIQIENAHTPGNEICSIFTVNKDSNTLLSRCTDGSLKSFDLRDQKQCLNEVNDLSCSFPEANIITDPTEQYVLVPVSGDSRQGFPGSMSIHAITDLSLVDTIADFNSSVVRLCWNEQSNQLAVGCSDGSVSILYDDDEHQTDGSTQHKQTNSQKKQVGILKALYKSVKRKAQEDHDPHQIIYTPDDNGFFREHNDWRKEKRKQKMLERQEQNKIRKLNEAALLPKGFVPSKKINLMQDPDQGSSTRQQSGSSSKYIAEDPRKELWKYSKQEDEDDNTDDL
ncbi:hypothetical protein MP228_010755 [Amoeboaphelidium protococcarum]|nr:hypothetical protein MP228_010755 [Amoeboaphelidium protococcarum]